MRSAFGLRTKPEITQHQISEEIRQLQPHTSITREVRRQSSATTSASEIGVHVRMQADLSRDIPGVSSLARDHIDGLSINKPVVEHRKNCHFSFFIPLMLQELEKDPKITFRVASDMSNAVTVLSQVFPGRIKLSDTVHRNRCDTIVARNTECLRIALVEFIMLSKSSKLILSVWSSATELILRLAAPGTPYIYGCRSEQGDGIWQDS